MRKDMNGCIFSLSTDIQQILTGNYAAESVEFSFFSVIRLEINII